MNGLIIAVRQERVARGGVRTVYGISASGKRRFQQLLNEQFAAEGSGWRQKPDLDSTEDDLAVLPIDAETCAANSGRFRLQIYD
jgi:hypothetical protein